MESTRRRIYTLVFVKKPSEILLGFKKRGLDKGKWNGFGGKVENETIEEGALRELKEECGLSGNLRRIGVLEFDGREKNTLLIVHVFDTYTYNGDITESEEMLPKWYSTEEIPFSEMKVDTRIWFPHMLKGNLFKGYFLYQGEDTLIDYKIELLTELDEVK
ncbi:7,8-dihydro-8-oxoguanine triphosphatase-like [Belonocnema kinseyi]|uniref:7,8-dihydro-8-oxoguanine triphosphatase-like n=1 Tax=Belonocnema kinseyi TaxID=2817044 RepID=UPI00143DE313|nr:7,8-dihydro-8-oxoguanine triphosphatase-like [Belonocnema kinseyi]XP_033223125.1 7,8-dihydro-8-oxoguanine triphosphatase-like [Belonocnema kinseyi]XP_033223126.1 7,8-dihydro-8-oxoguanine triphosphatase-like [Belonocnema kinseyi]XP_033223127.1 7,8-dihydro-8-oxoguanine triphosphatase-like [Belonocnema kinseyi]